MSVLDITPTRKRRVDREGPVQRAIIHYLAMQYPAWIVHHAKGEINKSGASIRNELAKAKGKGALKGFPDLIVLPSAHIGPIFLEVKAEDNCPDKDQRELHARMRALGYRVAVVRGVDDVMAVFAAWGVQACPER